MRDTPRPQGTVGDIRPGPPQLRPGRALAHTTGASGSGSPHRSDSRPPQTPGAADHPIRSAASEPPPVPGRPAFLIFLLGSAVLLFALITWQVVEDGPLLRVDERVSRALVHPDLGSAALADLGNVEVAVPVLVAALLWSARRARRTGTDRWWLPPVAAAALMALVPALVVPLKGSPPARAPRSSRPVPATTPRGTPPRPPSPTAPPPCSSSPGSAPPAPAAHSSSSTALSFSASPSAWSAAAGTGPWTWWPAGASARPCCSGSGFSWHDSAAAELLVTLGVVAAGGGRPQRRTPTVHRTPGPRRQHGRPTTARWCVGSAVALRRQARRRLVHGQFEQRRIDENAGAVRRDQPAHPSPATRPGYGTTIQVPAPAVRIPVPSQRAAVPGGTKKPIRASPKSTSTGPSRSRMRVRTSSVG